MTNPETGKDGRRICSIDGCDKRHSGRGFCDNHLKKFRRSGSPFGTGSAGKNNPNWRGYNVGLDGLHAYLRRNWPGGLPEKCQVDSCDRPFCDISNIRPDVNPVTYTRDFRNWKCLCRHHHMESDGRLQLLSNRPGRTGSDHPMFGKHHSEETKKKLSSKIRGRPIPYDAVRDPNTGRFIRR